MKYFASRDIKQGEELFIDYGPNYWSSRDKKKKKKNKKN